MLIEVQTKSSHNTSTEPQIHFHNIQENDDSQSTGTDDNTTFVSTTSGSNNLPSATEEEKMKYQALLSRIEAISANSAAFAPAFKKMLKNADAYASSESGLASTMHTFGSYSGVKAATRRVAKRLVQQCHKTVIGVQTTAPGHRKLLLSGKILNVGRSTDIRKPPKELSHHN